MLANDFDDLLRQRFEEEVPEYNPAAWAQLSAKLPGKKPAKRRMIALWPVSIGIAASITAAACMMFPVQQTLTFTKDAGHSTALAAPSPAKAVSMAAPSIILPIPAADSLVADAALPVPAAPQPPVMTSTPVPQARHTSDTAVVVARANANPQQPSTHSTTAVNYTGRIDYTQDDPAPVTQQRIVISLAGGMQYGSLNAGYAAAISVRHNVGRHWYVDAEMGYAAYNAAGAQQQLPVPGANPATASKGATAARSTGTGGDGSSSLGIGNSPENPAAPIPQYQSRNKIQYIQAAPGVGYRVNEHFTIGAAVDVQRALMSNNGNDAPVEDADGHVIPVLDLGAAGKAQWTIAKGVKAGLMYRHGLNTVMQGNHNYLDRHYMQVQVIVPLNKR